MRTAYPVTASVVYDLSVGAGGAGGNSQVGTNSVFNVNGEGANTTVLTANGGGRGGVGGATRCRWWFWWFWWWC